MGAVSAAQNITDGDETIINDIETDNYQTIENAILDIETNDSDSINYENEPQLQSVNEEKLQLEDNNILESKKAFDIYISSNTLTYGADDYPIRITTPQTNTKNIEIYLDNEKLNIEREKYPNDPMDFFINPENITIGTHTLKVVFKGDKNYLPLTKTKTIKKEGCVSINLNDLCYLNLPEDAKGDLALYLDNKVFNQTKIKNGYGEIQFYNKPGIYKATLKYTGDDYPVPDRTYVFDIKPEIKINGTPDSINISITCHESCVANITIKNKDTNQTIIEMPLKNGKADIKLENVKFENNFIIIYNSADYNYTNPYHSYSWEPEFTEHYYIGPGSHIKFNMPKNTSGNVKVELYESVTGSGYDPWNNKVLIEETEYTNGQGKINLPELSGGYYTFYVTFHDELYGDLSTFIYTHITPRISIPTVIYNDGDINFELYKAEGTLNIYIDDTLYATEQVTNGKANVKIEGLTYGNHNLTLTFNGTDIQDLEIYIRYYVDHPEFGYPYYYQPTYENNYRDYEFTQEIFYGGPISIMITNEVIFGNSALINIKSNENAKNVSIRILNHTYSLDSSEMNISLNNLEIGEYTVTVSYTENNTFYTFNKTFNVIPVNGTFGELEKLIKSTKGDSTLELNRNYVNTGLENEITISKSITIDGKGHILDANSTSRIFKFISYYSDYITPTIILKNIVFKNGNAKKGGAINAECEDYLIENLYWEVINCTFLQCIADEGGALYGWGNCNILNSTFTKCIAKQGGAIWSEDFDWTVINSTFTQCSAKQGGAIYFEGTGNKILNCKFNENTASKYPNWYSKNTVITEITSLNLKTTYTANPYYSIKIYGNDGKLVRGVKVMIKINGKTFKTIKTTNGIVKFKVTQTPGTYKLTITALKNTVTKTLTVKHLVTLKTVKVKKSAKKLTLQANLAKVNGKYLKNKQVTFKFNGKTYKAKTNSKGIAKVTIKSSVLKKLKVGKKITYQATYLKDTVKKTVKVQK